MNEIENITRELVCRDFELEESTGYEELRELLLQKIVYLLINDLPGLWNILYRIDVNERKLKQVFETEQATEIAPQITDLILQRFREKALTRVKYRA